MRLKRFIYILSILFLSDIFVDFSCGKVPERNEWGKEFHAQHAILRFEKSTRATRHKTGWKPTYERQRNSTPAIPTLTPAGAKRTSHRQARGWYYHFIQNCIGTGRAVAPAGQHPVCGYADYRQPGVFQEEVPKGDTEIFSRGRLIS